MPLNAIMADSWTALETAVSDAIPGDEITIELTNNIHAEGELMLPWNVDITLTSADNGGNSPYTLMQANENARHFSVSGSTLRLANVILSGNPAVNHYHGGIDLTHNGLLIMEAGSAITNNRRHTNGAGVYIDHSSQLIMEGGTISRNTVTGFLHRGGGVENDGTFIMRGGAISENEADLGGGVSVAEGEFIMEDGIITQNTGTWGGGGVAMLVDPSFTMTGGTISQNTAAAGGGVLVANNVFTMVNGTIDNNTAEIFSLSPLGLTGTFGGLGGGVMVAGLYDLWLMGLRVDSDDTFPIFDIGGAAIAFNMQGGSITDNTAHAYGGGIYVMDEIAIDLGTDQFRIPNLGAFTMQSGSIRNNHANNDGGGIFTEAYEYEPMLSPGTYGNLAMAAGTTFSGNTAGGGSFLPPTNPEITNINTMSSSITGRHALNNFDINFIGDSPASEAPDIEYPTAPTIPDLPTQIPPNGSTTARRPSASNSIVRPGIPGRPTLSIEPEAAPPEDVTLFRNWFIYGYPDGTVRPNGVITRAEMLQIFYNLSNNPAKALNSGTTRFTDLSPAAWYFSAIAYMERLGLVSGFPDGTVRPDQPITTAEFVTVAVKFFEIEAHLLDSGLISDEAHWAAAFVNLGLSQDWLDYFGITEFDPDTPITRVQSVALLNFYQGRDPNPAAIHAFLQGRMIFPDIQPGHWMFYEMIEAAIARYYHYDKEGNEQWISSSNIGRFAAR
ncbi:MAG: S-layer homology domain-containing protein, partial [Defluviitaleaceae bacterium]|nr:S-layer homology domain-containing protein [Defluviitaleaceae bacterium]